MNSYERVMNTLQGKSTDRIPVFAVLGAYANKLTSIDLKELYSNSNSYVKGQVALQDRFGIDMVLAPFDYSVFTEGFGGEVAWFTDQAPNMKKPVVKSIDQALKLNIPQLDQGRFPFVLQVCEKLKDRYDQQIPVVYAMPGPCIFPALIMGLEEWISAVLFEPEKAFLFLKHVEPFYLKWVNAVYDTGITAFIFTEAMATAEILPKKFFESFFLSHMTHVLSRVPGPFVFHHGGGTINPILDLLPPLDHWIATSVSSKDDLKQTRQILGQRPLIGNIDNLTFPMVNADEMKSIALKCIETAAPRGPYILCNSGADIPITTDANVIDALLKASQEYSEKGGNL